MCRVKVRAEGSSQTLFSSTKLHGVTSQNTAIFVVNVVRNSDLARSGFSNDVVNCKMAPSVLKLTLKWASFTTVTFRAEGYTHRPNPLDIFP